MNAEEIDRIQLQWIFACVIIDHCEHQLLRQKIQHALYYLRSKGVVRRVGKDRWEAVKKT